jgi:hypothetical protein
MFIEGTLNSTPKSNFIIEFFSSPETTAFGFGEGKTLIGSKVVQTDAHGNASFSLGYNKNTASALESNSSGNTYVTATATQKDCSSDTNPTCKFGGTSEFSKACAVTSTNVAQGTSVVCE